MFPDLTAFLRNIITINMLNICMLLIYSQAVLQLSQFEQKIPQRQKISMLAKIYL